ncbi:MAG: hypothetical protein ACJ75B_10405 [Flavisolibacter sp.]
MAQRLYFLLFLQALSIPFLSLAQNSERVSFDRSDNTSGYYLVIQPRSKQIKGTVLLLTSFLAPEDLLSETRLHNVAWNNDLLTVFAPMKQKLYADSFAVNRINLILKDIVQRFHADSSKFALGGYDEAGNIALRYTELSYQDPLQFPLQPKAVFAIDTPVNLFSLWHWAEGQIKKNYWPGAVGDAHYYLDTMTKENGSIYSNAQRYRELTPFYSQSDSIGNEQYLKTTSVRLYYDTDINWQLQNRRNSFYDTKMPEGSELIKRLLLMGNDRAEFMAAKQPGVRSDGVRRPNALSIVDEVDCIKWIKRSLDIIDLSTWVPTYALDIPKGWNTERFSLPAEFAPGMDFKGVEELRFPSGWGDSTSAEYWSYAYLWWLNGNEPVTEESLKTNFQALYTGLVGRNIISRQIPLDKQVATKVTVRKIKTSTGDMQTLEGESQMLDYMTQKPMVLHLLIHVKDCSKENHTAIFVEVSPKLHTHPVWKELEQLNQSFRCVK